jgi:haloalkane dehalogenase
MISVLAEAGYRVIAMDHLGCGRSDKPIDIDDYTYLGHNERLENFIEALELRDINLFVQDWGSLIGLRVAGLNPEWFDSIAVGNGALPIFPEGEEVFPPVENPNEIIDLAPFYADIPDQQVPFYNGCERLFGEQDNSYFGNWMEFAMKSSQFVPSGTVEAQTWFPISEEVEAAYDAPFPSRTYMAGIRKFPSLVNEVPGTTLEAWAGLSAFEKPFVTIWAANDPGQMGGCEAAQVFIDNVPGAAGQPHTRIPEASHFLEDDQGEEIAMRLVDFYEANGIPTPENAVGFELLEAKSANELVVWVSRDITEAEFDAIELPEGWFRNQPRESDPDAAQFLRSPDSIEDGPLLEAEHFGHTWQQNATVIETGIQMDEDGLLEGNRISKYHELTYNAGEPVYLLLSPEGDYYIRVSRDANRTQENPTIPDSWALIEHVPSMDLIFMLPNPTLNIRADNEDSFQGPLSSETLGLEDNDDNAGIGDDNGDPVPGCDDEPEIMTTADGTEFVRTPDACFNDLPDWPYKYQYVEIDGLRQAYAEAGPADGPVVLLLHGQPSWSYLYRKMIPVLADAGFRVIAMDHLGMGRSDKPTQVSYYTYLRHSDRLERFIEAFDLRDIALFAQDWGSLLGLRVAGLNTERFSHIAIGNGDLPVAPAGTPLLPEIVDPDVIDDSLEYFIVNLPPQQPSFYDGCELDPFALAGALGMDPGELGAAGVDFFTWAQYAMKSSRFQPSQIVEALTYFDLPEAEEAAYDAPYPSRIYMTGPRTFPSLASQLAGVNDEAWAGLTSFTRPFITIWGSNDPGNLGSCDTQDKFICKIRGAEDQPHTRIPEASHFLQDDQGAEIANRLVNWIQGYQLDIADYEASCVEDTGILELTPTLCDDPSNIQVLMDAMMSDGSDGDGSVFGDVNQETFQRMISAPTEGPFYMVNLIRYREWAEYPDGRETDLTGREADALYTPAEFLAAIGARVVFSTEVKNQIDGDDILWDDISIVEYPCPLAFFAMLAHPDFQARAVHKEAGVEMTISMVTDLLPIPAPADPNQFEAAFPPTVDDPAFDLIHVMDFHDIAQYEPDTNEPERTGEEAWQMYQASGQGASADLGHYSTAAFVVQGVFIGDDRTWDEIQIVHMSSMAGFQALLDDEARQEGRYHRLAALQNNYSMTTFPTISQIPYVDSVPVGQYTPWITADGTGTPCQNDEECPGNGVDCCMKLQDDVGLCTREGCEEGECQFPYVCCHDCNEALASMLAFEGSACIPEELVPRFTAEPLSCICD